MGYIRELDVRGVNQLITEIKDAERLYSSESEQAGVAGVLFVFFGILAGPAIAGYVTAAGLVAATGGFYSSNKASVINKLISQLESYKDTMQNNPSIDLIRIEVNTSTKRIEGQTFKYPSSANVIGFRSNGQWSTIN